MSRPNARYIDLVQCIINYTATFKLLCHVHLLKYRTSEVACNIQSSGWIQNTNLSAYCRYPASERFFWETITSSGFLQNRASRIVEGMAWCFCISAIQPFLHTLKGIGIWWPSLRRAALWNPLFLLWSTCSPTIISRTCVLHTRNRWEALDWTEHVFVIGMLNFLWKQSDVHVAGRKVLQKYLRGMKLLFMKQLTRGGVGSERVNEEPLGVLEMANALSFSGFKNRLEFIVSIFPIVIHRLFALWTLAPFPSLQVEKL